MEATTTATSIVEYVKQNYPKVIFTPVKFAYKNALGFIVTGGKIVVGFINKSGSLCKLSDPIDLHSFTNSDMETVIKKIPIVEGFNEKDKERLLKVFEGPKLNLATEKEHAEIVEQLKEQLQSKESEYKILFDSASKQSLAIQVEYLDKMKSLQEQYDKTKGELAECKNVIVNEKQRIIDELDSYKNSVKSYLRDKDVRIDELESIYSKMNEEKSDIQGKLDRIMESEQASLAIIQSNKDILSDYSDKLDKKGIEVEEMKIALDAINSEIELVKSELTKSKLKEAVIEGHQTRCQTKILKEKDLIIEGIKEYNKKWMQWSENVNSDFLSYRKSMVNDMLSLEKELKTMSSSANLLSKADNTRLRQNIKDIESQLRKVISDQLVQLNTKDSDMKMLENELSVSNKEKDTVIEGLRLELDTIKKLLAQNNNTKIEQTVDYDNCFNILQNFFALNNIFFRKQEIIKRLDEIIYTGIGSFTHLNDLMQTNLKQQFEAVKAEITSHIKFLDLEKYITSPNFQYLKSKVTRNKVPPTFCSNLTDILDYWNKNKALYRDQDIRLTNIYEDLSGAVRVYIRIKPLVGIEQKDKSVSLKEYSKKKQKSVLLNCASKNINATFGEFYGVFEDTYSTLDVYTGIENTPPHLQLSNILVNQENIIETSDSASPGLYNVFKQVSDGYSIVLFGYGLSGSGKTFTLLGTKGAPGLIHYGLANLPGKKNIKLKYLFEQYYGAVDVNFGKIRGKIHNLIREVPQMRDYAKNENEEFAKSLPGNLNTDNLRVEDLYNLTDIIEAYRVDKGRIKKTPNNPVSSRSHLYFVFEIFFDTGKTGYITIVDTAGRESPMDIYNMFIDPTKTKLPSIMAPSPVGGEGLIAKTKREGLDPAYTPKHINDVLKEGFYINETINHMVYYFNKKNYKGTKVYLQPTDTTKYHIEKYYVSPITEEKTLNASNNCLSIPIMTFLDKLSNRNKSDVDYKPTKFIMLCNTRQEEVYCEQTVETLKFAQTITST
jgi:hypothetical protein